MSCARFLARGTYFSGMDWYGHLNYAPTPAQPPIRAMKRSQAWFG